MKFKNKAAWREGLAVNDDGRINEYGGAVFWFAEHWADAMEAEIIQGKQIVDIAEQLSHQINRDMDQYGLTGFQYGCAVSILAQVWEYGEELRQWHNLKTQIHDEGERANQTGETLNPALLMFDDE